MFTVDEDVRKAVRSALEEHKDWHHGKHHVKAVGWKQVLMSYFDDANPKWSIHSSPQVNDIFWFSKSGGDFWFSNCGYHSRTTLLRINSCFAATGLHLKVFVSKGRFCIKSLLSGKTWICGDGKVTRAEVIKNLGITTTEEL